MANTDMITVPSRIDPFDLRPGDVVLTESRIGPGIKHVGVVYSADGEYIWIAHNQKREGLQFSTLECFLDGCELHLLERPEIYSIPELQQRIWSMVQQGNLSYHVMNWTCEDFVEAALGRTPKSQQRREVLVAAFELVADHYGIAQDAQQKAEFRSLLGISTAYGPLRLAEAYLAVKSGQTHPAVPDLVVQLLKLRGMMGGNEIRPGP